MENKLKLDAPLETESSLKEHQRALEILLKELDRVCKALEIQYVLFAGTLLGAVRHEGFVPWDDDLDVLMKREDYERFLREAEGVLDANRFHLQKESSEHWPMFFSKLRLNGTTCLEKFHPKDPMIHQGVYIDIFPCDKARATPLGRKLQFYASKVVIAKALTKRGYETKSKKKKVFMAICKMLPNKPFLRFAKSERKKSSYLHSFFAAASDFEKNVYEKELFDEVVDARFEEGVYPIPKRYDEVLTQLYGDYMKLPSEEERKIKRHAVLVDLQNSYEKYREIHEQMDFALEDITRSIR